MSHIEKTKTPWITNPYPNKRSKMQRYFLATIASAMMLLFACQGLSLPSQIKTPSAPAETIVPMSTPSSMPAPADTKAPDATAVPPTPSAEPPPIVSGFVTNPQIILTDGFTTMDRWHTYNPGSGSISNGTFVLTGQANWGSGVVFNQTLTKGFGVLINFKTEKNTDLKSQIVFNAGDYNTDSYRQFGFYTGHNPQTNIFLGKNGSGFQNLKGNLLPVANTWYSVLMAIGDNGELLAVIWNPADPAKKLVYHAKLGEKWAGQNWQFLAQADLGETVTLKDFNLLTFGAISSSIP